MTCPSIRTKWLSPTNTKGSRISVTDDADSTTFGGRARRRLTVGWDHSLNVGENHAAAAQAWLDAHNVGSKIDFPGLNFENLFYWTWTWE